MKTAIRDELRSHAANGASAAELAHWLQNDLASSFSVFDFVRYFRDAFGMPLETLRDAAAWVGFNAAGTLDDCAFDQLLSPWIDPFQR